MVDEPRMVEPPRVRKVPNAALPSRQDFVTTLTENPAEAMWLGLGSSHVDADHLRCFYVHESVQAEDLAAPDLWFAPAMRAIAIALLLLTTTAHADPQWVFGGGVGRTWAEFVPTGYKTLDAGLGGYLSVGAPVYTTADHAWSVEAGGRVFGEYMTGQQFPTGSISNEYEYLSLGGLAQGTLVVRQRAWLALGVGFQHQRIHDSAASNAVTTSGDDSYAFAAELGADIYSGVGLFVNTMYLGDSGWTLGAGLAFRFDTGP